MKAEKVKTIKKKATTKDVLIRSSIISLKYSNQGKRSLLSEFIDEYKRVTSLFVDVLWTLPKLPLYLDNSITSQANGSWLSPTAIQASAKQAKGIVSGAKKKQNQTIWKISDFKSKGEFKKARRLQAYFDKKQVSKPILDNVQPELDSRFCSIHLEDNQSSFDAWIKIARLKADSRGEFIFIPFNRHKHLNAMLQKGKIKTGIRLGKKNITLMFELPAVTKRTEGSVIGIDIGVKTLFSCSDNQVLNTGNHGHTFDSICDKLCRQKRGSKNFEQTVKHRDNLIHEMVNRLDLSGVKQVNTERIFNLRKGVGTSKKLQHFIYADIFEALSNRFLLQGVLEKKVVPTYTSQRCSACGWVLKANRNGKRFKCKSCSFELDADLNASRNISLYLPAISKEERLKQKNRKGFYWTVLGEDFMVPHTQKDQLDCDKNNKVSTIQERNKGTRWLVAV